MSRLSLKKSRSRAVGGHLSTGEVTVAPKIDAESRARDVANAEKRVAVAPHCEAHWACIEAQANISRAYRYHRKNGFRCLI